MKNALTLLLICCSSAWLAAQNLDSLRVAQQVDSLIKLSRDLTGKWEFDKALEANAAAEKIALEKLGRLSAGYGNCCFNHGRVLYFQRNYPEAEKWYLEAKTIREKTLGKEHPDYASSLNNLGVLYTDMGKYTFAEEMYLEVRSIREKSLGKEHPLYANVLRGLANLYRKMARYKEAEQCLLEALSTEEKLGKIMITIKVYLVWQHYIRICVYTKNLRGFILNASPNMKKLWAKNIQTTR